jgi:DNA-directed RNA polymerase specialized sigma24 family protein
MRQDGTVFTEADDAGAFSSFVVTDGARLRRVLVAHYGVEVGSEVASDALAWAWEHWDRVRSMDNPCGFLYRVAQSSARRYRRWQRRVVLPAEKPVAGLSVVGLSAPEPGLERALARLSASQRVAVLLVHGLDWSYQDAAAAMDVPITTIRNHLARGMARLRRELGEPT